MANDALQLPAPKNFSGKHADWDDFSFRFRSYMAMRHHDFTILLNMSETADHVITDADFVLDGGDPNTDGLKKSHELHYMLVQLKILIKEYIWVHLNIQVILISL